MLQLFTLPRKLAAQLDQQAAAELSAASCSPPSKSRPASLLTRSGG